MIPSCQKNQQTPQRQLNTCLLKSIKRNFSSAVDSNSYNHNPSLDKTIASKMSTLTADFRTAASAKATANNKPHVKPPMEAVVVNSIIYSKPSFCTIAVDLGDVALGKKASANMNPKTNGICPNMFQSQTFCSSSMGLKDTALNFEAATCLAGLAATPSALGVTKDTKVYRMCTTMNGSIHHQISDLCDNILAMAGFFGVTNNEHDDDSLIEFAYGDDGDEEEEDDDDDDEEYLDDEDDDYDEDLDDDNDVVDFSYECPIEPAPKLNCDTKKKVRFNTKPTVHLMHTWNYAYRAARKGEWEMYARDRERFKLRIHRVALTINPILEREHRQKIYEKRFASLYDNDDDGQKQQRQQQQTEAITLAVAADLKESKNKTSTTNESKKPHQKKKRRKKRFCKMGNKHYF